MSQEFSSTIESENHLEALFVPPLAPITAVPFSATLFASTPFAASPSAFSTTSQVKELKDMSLKEKKEYVEECIAFYVCGICKYPGDNQKCNWGLDKLKEQHTDPTKPDFCISIDEFRAIYGEQFQRFSLIFSEPKDMSAQTQPLTLVTQPPPIFP